MRAQLIFTVLPGLSGAWFYSPKYGSEKSSFTSHLQALSQAHAWKLLFTGGEALKMGLVRVPKEVCFSIVICLLMRTHGLGLLPSVSLSFHGILQMYSVDG